MTSPLLQRARRLCAGLLCLAVFSGHAAEPDNAAAQPAASPPWLSLEYRRDTFFGSAEAKLALSPVGAHPLHTGAMTAPGEPVVTPAHRVSWQLDVHTAVASNREHVVLQLAALNGDIVQKQRYSQGRKDRRFKAYTYQGAQVTRLRRDPLASEREQPPTLWSRSDQQLLALPVLPPGSVVSTPYALFLLASSPALAAMDAKLQVYIHTDYNLYRVTLQRGERTSLRSKLRLSRAGSSAETIAQTRAVDRIELLVEDAGMSPAKPDFEVMGLRGEISFLVDVQTRLPLRIEGGTPGRGSAYLDLASATLP